MQITGDLSANIRDIYSDWVHISAGWYQTWRVLSKKTQLSSFADPTLASNDIIVIHDLGGSTVGRGNQSISWVRSTFTYRFSTPYKTKVVE